MIYLIGGSPKCGKTTLAKKVAQDKGLSWISTDTIQNVIKPYLNEDDFENNFPSSAQRSETNDEKYSKYSTKEIIDAYRKQARTVFDAIDMVVVSEITDGRDFVIEGYHIEPEFVAKLSEKYPNEIKSVFLVKTDEDKFIENIKNSTTPNDWIVKRTQNEEAYGKIAKMVCEYSRIFEKEAKKYEFDVVDMNENFDKKIEKLINIL